MQRGRIVDAISEETDDVAPALECEENTVLLRRRDPREDIRLLRDMRQRRLSEREYRTLGELLTAAEIAKRLKLLVGYLHPEMTYLEVGPGEPPLGPDPAPARRSVEQGSL